MKTYKFKLYNSKKNKYFDGLIETAREIYNWALEQKRAAWKLSKYNLSQYELQNMLKYARKADPKWKSLNCQAARQACERIINGYTIFFSRFNRKMRLNIGVEAWNVLQKEHFTYWYM